MALEDFVALMKSHQFGALLHFWQLGDVTQAKAKTIVEADLGRTLTTAETGYLADLKAGMVAGDFTAREYEAASMLLEAGWVTVAEFKTLLGLT